MLTGLTSRLGRLRLGGGYLGYRGFCQFFVAVLLITTMPQQSFALWEWRDAQSSADVRLALRVMGNALYARDNAADQSGLSAVGRLLFQGHRGENWAFDFNMYHAQVPASLLGTDPVADVERSSLLDYSYSDNAYAHSTVDRMSVRWSHPNLDVVVGRQAVNLATTFYFSPNDLFGSFRAQTFYREYKPGVDALQLTYAVNPLSVLSWYSVLAYRSDTSSSSGWSDSPEWSRSSHLARLTFVRGTAEWGFIGGSVRGDELVAGSVSAEAFQWLGLRAEAQLRRHETERFTRVSLGLEHRWENSLDARLELFYNGNGAGQVSQYNPAAVVDTVYLARRYAAVGVSYEFMPLLLGQLMVLVNRDDHSYLLSANSVYSLDNESELAFSIALPGGRRAQSGFPQSEYGSGAYSIALEWRMYQ